MQALPQRRNPSSGASLTKRSRVRTPPRPPSGSTAGPAADAAARLARNRLPEPAAARRRGAAALVTRAGRTIRYDADLSAPRPLLVPGVWPSARSRARTAGVRGGAATARARTRGRGARAGIRRNLPGLPAPSKVGREETLVKLKRPKTHENSTHVLAGESPVNRRGLSFCQLRGVEVEPAFFERKRR